MRQFVVRQFLSTYSRTDKGERLLFLPSGVEIDPPPPAETALLELEPDSCCSRCLRLLPRSARLKPDASVDLGRLGAVILLCISRRICRVQASFVAGV